MITKHFFKVLAIFAVMIALGMVGILILNSIDNSNNSVPDQPQIAK